MLATLLVLGMAAGVQGGPAACAGITQDAARLSCYDSFYRGANAVAGTTGSNASPGSTASVPGTSAPAGAAAAASAGTVVARPATDPVADFGLTEQQKQEKQPNAAPSTAAIEGVVREVKRLGVDRWTLYLENGQVWAQAESTPRQPFKAGDAVRIRQAAMSSFLATGPNSGGTVRVRRVR